MEKNNAEKEHQTSWAQYLKKKLKQKKKRDQNQKNKGLKEITITISGMTCTHCEMRIEQHLENLPGIKKVKVSYNNSLCVLTYNEDEITLDEIIQTIKAVGYGVVESDNTQEKTMKEESFSIKQLIGIAIIITALFLVLNKTGIFNLVPEVDESVGYGLLFVIGLLTSLHCIAMCGGINLSQAVNKTVCDNKNVLTQLKPGVLYNVGRLISYTIIGGVVGVIGSFVSFSGGVQGIIIIIAGLFMVIMGINMLDVFPFFRKFSIKPPRVLRQNVGKLVQGRGPFIVGLLNGFMPCGPLQTMQLYALSTGSFIAGASSMFLFCLGTIPLMFGFGALGALLTKKFTHRMLKISAILVFLLGVGMISRGLSLSGINPEIIPQKIDTIAELMNNIQIIETDMQSSYYEPIIVQKGIPVRWNIKATEKSLNGCNNPLTIPGLKMTKRLVPGDNYIEFLPEKSGKIAYTCWMGMITSTILVVDDISTIDKRVVDDVYRQASKNTGCGGCASNPGGCGKNSGTGGCSGVCGSTSGRTGCGSTAGSCSLPATAVDLPKLGINTDSIGFAEIIDTIQYAYVDVTEDGYYPEIMVMQRGIPTEWIFRGLELDNKNYRMEFPAYRARIELKEGDNTISKFLPQMDFHYISWEGDYTGFISVVDDISRIDKNEIEENVENYIPYVPQSSGCGSGSCGR